MVCPQCSCLPNCGVFYIAKQIPVYSVSSSIYLSQDNNSSRNAFSMDKAADPMVALKNYIDETELEVLKSRNNLIKIVDSLNLAYSYCREGTFRDVPLYNNNAIIAKLDSLSLRSLKAPISIEVSEADGGKYNVSVHTEYNDVDEDKDFEEVSLPLSIELSQGTVTLTQSPVIQHNEGQRKNHYQQSPLGCRRSFAVDEHRICQEFGKDYPRKR